MLLTIWRHGEAGEAPTDYERRLTTRGRDQLRLGAVRFRELCLQKGLPAVEHIAHSPWLRTAETAELLREAFPRAACNVLDVLRPGAVPTDIEQPLQSLLDASDTPAHLVLVSHQPLVSRLINHLTDDAGRTPALNPGGLAVLSLDTGSAGCADLVFWALPPHYEAGR